MFSNILSFRMYYTIGSNPKTIFPPPLQPFPGIETNTSNALKLLTPLQTTYILASLAQRLSHSSPHSSHHSSSCLYFISAYLRLQIASWKASYPRSCNCHSAESMEYKAAKMLCSVSKMQAAQYGRVLNGYA